MRPVLIRLYAAIARHPRSFAIGASALILLLTVVACGDSPWWPAAAALLAAAFLATGLSALPAVVAGKRPSFLLARDGAFVAPVDVPEMLFIASVMAAFGGGCALAFSHIGVQPGTQLRWQPLLLTAVVGLSAWPGSVSRRTGIAVRRYGVTFRRREGSLTIPWPAEPLVVPADPLPTAWERFFQSGDRMALLLRRGDLAQIDGHWPANSIVPSTVDPAYLAWVVKEYADHPDRRAAIGTPEELRRLVQSPR
jgi:hypothetical protein